MGLFDRLKGKNKSVEGPVKNKFIELLVLETNHPTTDSIEITFDTADHPGFLQFNPGQYLTVRQTFEKEERRSYSICSSPHEHRLTIAAKRVEKGLVSNWLNDNVVKGFKLEVMPPAGNFYNSSRVNGDSFVLFAGGSGITPIISIIKHTLDSNPSSQIQLVYANRNEESIIFKDELSQLETKFENFSVSHVLSEENKDGYAFGLVDQTFIESNLVDWYDKESNVFLCGPSGFMENVQNSLENLGHNSAKINVEYFIPVTATKTEEIGSTEVSKVTIVLDGEETKIDIPFSGDNILSASLDAGLDAPYSCQGAVCSTCKAKVIKGKVAMDMNHALLDSEVKDGYILTCQAHPRSEELIVDYDQGI